MKAYGEAYGRLLGVRYVYMGRDEERDGGLDCWGYVRRLYELAGLPVPPAHVVTTDEERIGEFTGFSRDEWVPIPKPEEFSVVLMRYERGGKTRFHCGVVCPDLVSFTHCMGSGVRRDSIYDRFWTPKIMGFYRYGGLGR